MTAMKSVDALIYDDVTIKQLKSDNKGNKRWWVDYIHFLPSGRVSHGGYVSDVSGVYYRNKMVAALVEAIKYKGKGRYCDGSAGIMFTVEDPLTIVEYINQFKKEDQ